MPVEANVLFSGVSYIYPTGEINLHMLTYFVCGGAFAWLFFSSKKELKNNRFLRTQIVVFSMMLIIEIAIEILGIRNEGGISNQLPDVYIGPIFFYFILINILHTEEQIKKFINIFIFLMVLIALSGLLEFFLKNNFYLAKLLKNQDVNWYKEYMKEIVIGNPYRIITTLGHPLTNAAYFLTSFIFVFYSLNDHNKSKIVLIIISLILFTALILTFSRSAFILASLGLIWYFLRNKKETKIGRLIIFLIVITVILIILQPLLLLLANRDFLFNDSSASVRFSTISAFMQNITSLSFWGYGPKNMEGAINMLFSLSTSSSLEIGYVMMILQFGFIFFFLYLLGVLLPFKVSNRKIYADHKYNLMQYKVALILLLLDFGVSNTIGVRSTINYLFFIILAMLSSKLILIQNTEVGK